MLCLQVFTSDHALKLDWIPKWIAIIGSGYIGLEFSDVYTALGSEVTFIEVWHCKRNCAEVIRHLQVSQIKLLSQGSSMPNCHETLLHLLVIAACARFERITSTFLSIDVKIDMPIHVHGHFFKHSSNQSTACCLKLVRHESSSQEPYQHQFLNSLLECCMKAGMYKGMAYCRQWTS